MKHDNEGTMDAKTPKYTAPALEKGLDILEHLSQSESGLTQAEIARVLGRSVSEIFRMLVVLQERGYITFDAGSDRYVLTTLLFEIAHRTSQNRPSTFGHHLNLPRLCRFIGCVLGRRRPRRI